jgi:hypothetical protein
MMLHIFFKALHYSYFLSSTPCNIIGITGTSAGYVAEEQDCKNGHNNSMARPLSFHHKTSQDSPNKPWAARFRQLFK